MALLSPGRGPPIPARFQKEADPQEGPGAGPSLGRFPTVLSHHKYYGWKK